MDDIRNRVLIVDDEESIRNVICRKLQAEGYECIATSDGTEALETASTQQFDLVLTDVKMPGISGIDVLSRVITDHPDTAVIMITAVAHTQTAVDAMKMGAYDYVIKPFDLDDLTFRVTRALEAKRLAIENREYQENLERKVAEQVGNIRQHYREAIRALADSEVVSAGDSPPDSGAGAAPRVASSRSRRAAPGSAEPPGAGDQAEREEKMEMARALALVAETREPYARGHSQRVNTLANEIAIEMGCPEDSRGDLELAAIVHDIGKITVSDHILFKPGDLTPAEHNEVKRHPIASAEILRHVDCLNNVIPIVESHHEWFNGKGYPNRLSGDAIPLGARIMAVADAYDAMTCARPHRPRLTDDEASQVLRKGSGKQWDPAVVDAFIRVLERQSQMLHDEPSL